MGAFSDTVLTVQRRRNGGKQVVRVIHQQVAVGAGKPDWKAALVVAQAAPRCRARGRRSKLPCRVPAMRGRPVCRVHGGKGGAPTGERNGAYRTGHYTAEAKTVRREQRTLIRELWRLMIVAEE